MRSTGISRLPALLEGDALRLLQRYVSLRLSTGSLPREDGRECYAQYGDPTVEALFGVLAPRLAAEFGEPVAPSYGYLRTYLQGSLLEPHVDRAGCDFTLSLAVAATGNGADWPLFARDLSGVVTACKLSAGDAVLMRGREVRHWRAGLTSGWATFVFLHWVRVRGDHERFDGRPGLGFPA